MDQNQQPGMPPQNQPPPPQQYAPPPQYQPPPSQQYGPPPGGGMPPGYPPPPPPKRKSENKILGWVIGIVAACVILPVLGIVATITIPLMLSARNGAVNEKARNYLRTIVTAEAAYYAKESHYAYIDTLVSDGYLDDSYITGLEDGIIITLELDMDEKGYQATAFGRSTHYTADETGEINSW